VNIFSTVSEGYAGFNDDRGNGTSFAAPIVAGIVGLVWSVDPRWTAVNVKDVICNPRNTIHDVPSNPASPRAIGDFRMVNAYLAVGKAIESSWIRTFEDEDDNYSEDPAEANVILSGTYRATDSITAISGFGSFTFSDRNRVTASTMMGMMSYHGIYEITTGVANMLGTVETLVFTWDGDTSASVNMAFEVKGDSLIINGAEYRR
jgi:hypothetical protein